MGTVSSGVYPVYENQFKINPSGRSGGGSSTGLVTIADMESFSVSFDDNVE